MFIRITFKHTGWIICIGHKNHQFQQEGWFSVNREWLNEEGKTEFAKCYLSLGYKS